MIEGSAIGREPAAGGATDRPRRRTRLVFLVPVVMFLAIAVGLAVGLTRNPRDIPSALIGRPVPAFELPPVRGRALGLSSANLEGEVALVNVFASWCTACRDEHPLFMRLKEEAAVPIHGLNYKDRPERTRRRGSTRWATPYTRTGADLDGRVAIDWGVYGVPETFVVGRDGRIAHKHIGPVTPEALDGTILPPVERLRAAPDGVGERP